MTIRYVHGASGERGSMFADQREPEVVVVEHAPTAVIGHHVYPLDKSGLVVERRVATYGVIMVRAVDERQCVFLDELDQRIARTRELLRQLEQSRQLELRALAARGTRVRVKA